MTLRIRTSLRKVHFWLGISLGLLFALLSLTGSALVFYPEIDAALNPLPPAEESGPAPGWQSPVWDAALATGRKHWLRGGDFSFEATGAPGPIPARYYPPSGPHGHHAEREMVWFSADGSSVLRSETWGEYLMSWLYELHMHLLAGEAGRQIVGWSGFVALVLLATGIAAWWPRGSWQKALAFKRKAVRQRRLRDLHKHAGLWSSLLLVLLSLTGSLLALPDIKARLFTATIAAPDQVPAPTSKTSSGIQIPVRKALDVADRAVPHGKLAFIDVPDGGTAAIRIRVQVPGDPHRRFPGSFVFVDQYSGELLAVHDVRDGNAGTVAAKWLRPIHDGSLAGLPTRILAVLIGLLPPALLITGLLHWRNRRSARHRATQHHESIGTPS